MTNTTSTTIKQLLKKVTPIWLQKLLRAYLWREYKNLSTQQVFTKIYEEGVWGKPTDPDQKFFSGSGSNDPSIRTTYVKAIQNFLSSFEHKPSVVDLGCGDFSVGSTVRQFCDRYIACDIVEPVIKSNKERFKNLNVDFRMLDITKDELPAGDIVFIRQVLQHLSNDQISSALPQIASKYKYLVLTEHLPSNTFVHNLNKPAGPDVRLNSGVVLTSAPFNLQAKEEICLCEAPESGGIIRTTLYRLA